MSKYKRNILAVFNLATPSEVSEGLHWYRQAHKLATTFESIAIGAGVIAAMSPQISWDKNVTVAEELRDHGDATMGLGDAKAKAKRILDGEHPSTVLGGKKVRAFYECVANPETTCAVCVDRHAWALHRFGVDEIGRRHEGARRLDKVGVYERVAADYVDAASELRIMPHQLQAITWLAWRRLAGASGGAEDSA